MVAEVRVAVVGNVDSGKSTTLGVLTRGMVNTALCEFSHSLCITGGLDDGRGRARVGLFRHKHEIETGRTSSVGMEVCNMKEHPNILLTVGTRFWAMMLPVNLSSPLLLPQWTRKRYVERSLGGMRSLRQLLKLSRS